VDLLVRAGRARARQPLEARVISSASRGNTNFYGRLAAEELGVNLRIPARAPLPTESEIAEVAAIPGLARALALYRLDMRTEATKEWLWPSAAWTTGSARARGARGETKLGRASAR